LSLASFATAKRAHFHRFVVAARADYGKLFKRSNQIAEKCSIWPANKTLHPASGSGFIPVAGMNRCRMKILYSGHVQGVGFRYTAKTVAAGFEIAGIVRNLPDGRVELVAEGAREELEGFRQAIRGAGLTGFIRNENVTWSEAQNEFHGFEIVH
jgi:acylphosphatase